MGRAVYNTAWQIAFQNSIAARGTKQQLTTGENGESAYPVHLLRDSALYPNLAPEYYSRDESGSFARPMGFRPPSVTFTPARHRRPGPAKQSSR